MREAEVLQQQADLMFEDQAQRLGIVKLDDEDVDDVDVTQQVGQDPILRALDIGLDQHVPLARDAAEDGVDGRVVRLLAAIEHALPEVHRAVAKEPAVVAPDADPVGHARDAAPAAQDMPDALGDVLDEAPRPDRVVVTVDVDAGWIARSCFSKFQSTETPKESTASMSDSALRGTR